VGYSLVMLMVLPWSMLLSLSWMVYCVYLTLLSVQFLLALLLVSERPWHDLKLALVLPLFPIATFVLRCWSAVTILNEWWRRGHEESSMAPWWVLQRATRF